MRVIEILVLTGASSGDTFRFSLEVGDSIKVGRADSNDLVLADPRISRTHCGLLSREDAVYVYDLGSAAGTVHMGFQLKPGEAGARALATGDEFKIGDSLFRVQIQEDTATEAKSDSNAERKAGMFASKKVLIAVLAGVLLLALFFSLAGGGGGGRKLPAQKSHIAVTLPAFRMLGYWPGSSSTPATHKDSRHLDQVQFLLPATDVLVEYDYISEVPIEITLDGVTVDSLSEYSASWRRGQVLVRDVAQGVERRLVFDNLNYPSKDKKNRYKRWAVRNVRITPMSRALDASVEQSAQAAAALVDTYERSPDGLFLLVRALQQTLLELLIDQSVDAVGFTMQRAEVVDERSALDAALVSETLDAIVEERSEEYSPGMDARHLQAVSSLIATFDGELWRRVDSRFRQAKHSAEANNSIVVYDNLVAIKTMFPDESDYRWVQANTMLNDKKYVPKKVRDSPGRYRR